MAAPILTVGELAVRLGVRETHVRKLCNLGKLPHQRAGKTRVFQSKDVPAIRAALVRAGYLSEEPTAPAAH